MKAFFKKKGHEADEIAAMQASLQQHVPRGTKLLTTDVKEMFLQMRDHPRLVRLTPAPASHQHRQAGQRDVAPYALVRGHPGTRRAKRGDDLALAHLLGDLAAKRDRIQASLQGGEVEPFVRGDEIDGKYGQPVLKGSLSIAMNGM